MLLVVPPKNPREYGRHKPIVLDDVKSAHSFLFYIYLRLVRSFKSARLVDLLSSGGVSQTRGAFHVFADFLVERN
jgi:hypothetical protein